jgi:hypothetical protein
MSCYHKSGYRKGELYGEDVSTMIQACSCMQVFENMLLKTILQGLLSLSLNLAHIHLDFLCCHESCP